MHTHTSAQAHSMYYYMCNELVCASKYNSGVELYDGCTHHRIGQIRCLAATSKQNDIIIQHTHKHTYSLRDNTLDVLAYSSRFLVNDEMMEFGSTQFKSQEIQLARVQLYFSCNPLVPIRCLSLSLSHIQYSIVRSNYCRYRLYFSLSVSIRHHKFESSKSNAHTHAHIHVLSNILGTSTK